MESGISSRSEVESPGEHSAALCGSCGHPLSGRFCSECGEEAHESHDLSLRHFLTHSVLHEFTHVDGKILRTLRGLLFRPGFLTCEYFAGRRGLYLTPMRLLLTAALLFALLAPPNKDTVTVALGRPPILELHLSMLPPAVSEKDSIEENVKKLDVANVLTTEWQAVQKRRPDMKGEITAEKFNRYIEGYGEILSFCSVIPLALLTWLIYGRKKPYFVQHFVFALHLEAFLLFLAIFLNSLGAIPIDRLPRQELIAVLLGRVVLTYLAQAWYLQNSLIRFFETGAFPYRYNPGRRVAWKTASIALVLFIANSFFLSVVHTIGAMIALWRLSL